MNEENLTAKQLEILKYIKDEIVSHGYPPSVREIGAAVSLRSTSSVYSQLEKLEEKGFIRRDASKNRAIEIVDDDFNLAAREISNIPLVGRVAAGQPVLAAENIEDYFPLPTEYMPNTETFMLRVSGDSMVNAGILDGDLVMVSRQKTASNGEIVVALLEDEATVKRIYREDGHIRLQPENDFMEPIIVDHCEICGKVFGVLRLIR